VETSKPQFLSRRPNDGATYTPEQIRKYLSTFRCSGLSVAAFARQQGLSDYRLRSWLQRAKRPAARPGRPDFHSVPMSSLLAPAWAAEVVGPTGVTVRLSAQVPPELGLQLAALSCPL